MGRIDVFSMSFYHFTCKCPFNCGILPVMLVLLVDVFCAAVVGVDPQDKAVAGESYNGQHPDGNAA